MAAPKPDQEQQTRLDEKDARDLVHDFAYRPDTDVDKVAQRLEEDWDNAYNWLRDKLEQAKGDE